MRRNRGGMALLDSLVVKFASGIARRAPPALGKPSCVLIAFHSVVAIALAADSDVSTPSHVFDVREFGAQGDGVTLDTRAIQAALDAANASGGGQARIPAGRYLSGSIHLRSGVTLSLEAGAVLLGSKSLDDYDQPVVPEYMPEAKWGKWHRALIVGEQTEGAAIVGPGTIDGNRVFDPTGEEKMRGPHAVAFVDCRGFKLRDVTITDAANYALFFQASDDVEIRNCKFVGGWDGVHWRGAPDHWCHNVAIVGCQFQTGDDAIAGRYWENTLIANCLINSSCNGIRLIGPAKRLTIHNNLFHGPGERPHLTSKERMRNNMLSGILLQPGAWDATHGALDNVVVSDNTMRQVASPLGISLAPGNDAGRITILGLRASGVYRAAISIESWAESPIGDVSIRDAIIEYDGGGSPDSAPAIVKRPGVDARELPVWGLYARRVERLTLEDVHLSLARDDLRPVVLADSVSELRTDNLRYPRLPAVTEPIVLTPDTKQVRGAPSGE